MRREFKPNIRAACIDPDRFWAKVDRSGTSCWPWKGKDEAGYGRVLVRVMSERGVAWRWEVASRIAYELAIGSLSPTENVLHSCDNPICVRPDHLTKGTQQDNANGAADRGRYAVKLSRDTVRLIREEYATNPKLTIMHLAKTHDVAYQTVWKIVTGKIWKRTGGPIGGRFKRWGDNPSRSPWTWTFSDGRATVKRPSKRPFTVKLTEEQVRAIRKSQLTGRMLAAQYGVAERTIWAVRWRETWKDIK